MGQTKKGAILKTDVFKKNDLSQQFSFVPIKGTKDFYLINKKSNLVIEPSKSMKN